MHYYQQNSALIRAFLKFCGLRAPRAPIEETPMDGPNTNAKQPFLDFPRTLNKLAPTDLRNSLHKWIINPLERQIKHSMYRISGVPKYVLLMYC